jgi:hypothetical protein
MEISLHMHDWSTEEWVEMWLNTKCII